MYIDLRFSRTPSLLSTMIVIVWLSTVMGCARSSEPGASAAPAVTSVETTSSGGQTQAARDASSPMLTRALVEQTVSRGLGVFLSRISLTPVVDRQRFVGFRLDAAEDLEQWRAAGADLRLGDVIQRINGQPIERPEQALWTFDQLRIARGIEIVGMRGSAPFRVYSPIVDSQ
jgi:type II secretory pathway component PulC